MNNVDVIEVREFRKLTVLEKVQVALLILLIIVGIATFFISELIVAVFIILAVLLFIMGWTNFKIRKKTTFGILYFVFGLITAFSAILEILRII